MAILKRENKYQGLKDIDVFVEESGLTSQYFQVFDFPEAIPQGKSSFLIAGSPFLKDNVEIKIEILDAGGNTIYTEAITNYLEGQARRVSIEVYDDVVPGDGQMYIVGELKSNYKSIASQTENQDEITGEVEVSFDNTEDIPDEFQDVYNIRFVRPVFINATLPNEQPIFFYQQPRITVTEVVKAFIEELQPSGSVTLSGSVEVNPAPDLPPLPPVPDPPDGFPQTIFADGMSNVGQANEIFKSSKKSKVFPFKNSNFKSRGRLVRRASPEQDKFTIKINDLEKSGENDAGKASSALIGATLKIKSPRVDTTKFPTDKFTIPDTFETSIKSVKNESTIVPLDDFLITDKTTGEQVPAQILSDPVDGSGTSEVTMSYQPFPTQSLSTTHFRSFADITVANLRTFSGDVYKAKIYARSKGSSGDFEVIHDGTIESPQTLIDPFSVDGFLNTGYFHTQSIIDEYWIVDNGTATKNDEKILDGALISGSNYQHGSSVQFTTSQSFALERNVPYAVTFNTYYYKEDSLDKDGNVSKDFELEVFVEEAALIGGSLSDTYRSVGKVDLGQSSELQGEVQGVFTTFVTPADIGPTLKLKFAVNKGRAVISDVVVRPHSETNFNPDFFRVIVPMTHPLPKRPDQYDFICEFYDINNNIAETFSVRENVEFRGASINIDGENNLLSGSLFVGNQQGEGFEMAGASSAYLRSIGYNGFDNTIASSSGGFLLFSGSIGGRLTSSEDYEGVGLEIVDAHGSQDRFLKFRTNPSTFQVVTDEFFLGQAGNSFISGSNGNLQLFSSGNTTLSGSEVDVLTPNFYLGGDNNFISGSGGNIEIFNSGTTTLSGSAVNILTPSFFFGGETAFVSGSGGNVEISSSNFHLTTGGDVTMSGDITANAGFIGDFAIIDGKISGSNITMDANNSTIFKTDQGPGSDSGESFRQLKNEFYIDFTPETENPDNFHVKFGPNFSVDKDGLLFASGAKFEGTISASAGLIGGFTTDSSSFSSTDIFISGSPAIGGVDNDRYKFINTTNFNVKQDGDVTGSAVLFSGGKIAAWNISGNTLSSIGDGGIRLNGNGDNAEISVNSHTFGNAGVQLGYNGGAPRFYVGDGSNNFLKFTTSGGVDIQTLKFELDATDVAISSTHASMSLGHDSDTDGGVKLKGLNGGSIALGGTLPTNLSSDGIFLSGSGDFNLQGDSSNFLRRVGTALTIKAGTFDLDATTLILDSAGDSGNGVIRLGGSGGPSSPTSTTAGIYMDGGGALNVVGNSTNFLRTDAGSLTINTDTLDLKTNTLRVSSSNGGVVALGSTLPQKLEDTGLFLSGSGQFSFFSSSRGHIVFDGTDFKIASENLTIDTSTLDINTAGGGNIALGSGSPSLSAAGIFLSGSGDFNFMKDSNNFIRQSGGTFQIKADTFDLATSTLIIDSATNSGKIALGSTPNTSVGGTNKGIYMDGTGDFLVRGDANNFLKFDASGNSVQLKSDTFDLQTTTFSASSAGTGKISLGQTPPTRYDSGNGIFFDGDANFLIGSASGDRIQFNDGDFVVQVGSLELDASNIEISSTNASMSLGEGNIILDGANNKIKVGKISNKQVEIVGSNTQGYIATGKTSATSTTAGFWLANNNTDPEFAVGNANDKIVFNGGNLEIASQNLEISSSTLQVSTTEQSMSLGHNDSNKYGKIILQGSGTPKLALGPSAHTLSLTNGSGVFIDGDGNFKFGDSDGNITFDSGNFSITGSDVDINVTDINITATGFRLSSTHASMSLGTNDQLFMEANSSSPFLSIGQGTKGFGQTGVFLGFVNSVSRPRVSFVGSTGHFKVDQDVDIQTETFELDANSGDLQISSAHKSMSLADQAIVLDGTNSKISVGAQNTITIKGSGADSFIAMEDKTGMDGTQGSGTSGILIGMDGSNPQAEFVKGPNDYFIFDNGVDIKTTKLELDAGSLQLSNTHNSMSLSPDGDNPIRMVGDGTDAFIVMGGKTTFDQTTTQGIIIGMDSSVPKFDITKGTGNDNYFRFDSTDGIDIKTDKFKLDTARLDIDSSTARISVFDLQSDEVVRIGELTGTNTFGMKIFDGVGTGTSNELVKLGGDGNEIAGWTITNSALTGGSMIIRQDGTIESAGFATNVPGSGFRLTAANGGFLEVENARIRGTMSTTVFEKESVNAVGGQLYVANSTTIKSGSIVTATATTMSVDNVTGFTGSYNNDGEIISAKKVDNSGFSTEYMLIQSASRDEPDSDTDFSGKLFVVRGYSGSAPSANTGSLGDLASSAQFYSGSQVLVSTGRINTGYIRLNANPNDETTPYIDIVERTGSAIYDVELKARLGDLSGLSSGLLFGNTSPGFGLFTENVFLQGAITATTGSITGILHVDTSDTQKLSLGKDVSGDNDGIQINDVNYWYTTGNFKVGDSAGNFISSSGEISTDKLEVDAGTGDLQISSTNKSMSFADGDLVLKKDGSDASITVGGTASKSIKILGSNTQGYIASGKTSVNSLTSGFWLANNDTTQEFHIGDGSSAIKYDGSNIHFTSSKFELDAGEGDLQISSQHKSMSLGDRSFEVVGDQSNNLTLVKVGQHTIQNIQMTGSANAGILKSGKKGINDLNAGFYMSNEAGTALFHVGDGSSAFKFDGSNLHITASQANLSGDGVSIDVNSFELDSSNIEISSGEASMSVGYETSINGGINIKGGATSTIGFGSKASPRMKLSSDTNDSFIQIGSPTFADVEQEGILIGMDGSNPEFHLYKDGSNFFRFDAGATPAFDLKTTSLEIATAGLSISGRDSSTSSNNKISLGTITSDSDTSGAGVFMDGGGHFRVFGDANNFMIVDGGSLQIKSDNIDITSTAFSLDANSGDLQLSSAQKSASFANGKIVIEGSSTNGSLKIGTVSSVTDTGGSNKGFFAEGDGDFIAKAGANEYVKFDSGKLGIKASDLSILTTGANKIKMESSASTPVIALGTTLPTAHNSGEGFYVDGTGKMLLGDASDNHVKYDGSTLTVAGTINIISGDLAGVTSNTISGSYPPESASQDLSFATQVVLDSAGMSLKNADASKTLASYGATSKIFDGENSNTYVEVGGKGVTQVSGSVTGSLLTNGVMSFFGNGVEKATISSTGSVFRGDNANTFARVDSNGLTIVDNAATKATFGANTTITGGTITLRNTNNNNDNVVISENSFVVNDNGSEVANFGANTTLTGGTITIRNSTNNNDNVVISENSFVVNDNGSEVANFGANTTLTGGTITIRNSTNNNDNVVISENSFVVNDNGSEVANFGANTTLTGGTITIRSSDNNNDNVVITQDSVTINDNGNAVASFGANTVIEGGTVTIRNTTNNNDNVVISENSFVVNDNGNAVASFGANTVLEGGTITLRNTTNNNDNVVISEDSFVVNDNGSEVANFGANTTLTGGTITIRNATNNNDKVVISEDSFEVFDNNNAVASFGANTVIEGGTVTIRNTTNNNDNVVISENSFVVNDNGNAVASFGANTVLEGGTITLRNTTNNNDNVVISENSFVVNDNGNEVANFGANTVLTGGTITIRNSTNNNDKVVISEDSFQIFDNNTSVSSFGASMRVGEADNTKSALKIASDGVLTIGTELADKFQVDASGNVEATSLQTNNTSLVPSITQGFINPGAGSLAKNSGILYYQQVALSSGGTMISNTRRLLDISGDASGIAPDFARGANFVRMGSGTLFDNRVITDIRFKKVTSTTDQYRVAQIMLEGAEGEPFITDRGNYSGNVYLKQATDLTTLAGTWTNVGSWLSNNAINRDSDDLWNPAFVTQTVGIDGDVASFKLTSGNRIFLVGNALDFKLVAANSYDVMRPNFDGGLNVGSTSSTAFGSYELYVGGDIGATGNITAYADYVCNSCGWHSARETKVCPSCGSKDVHYHDDVQLLKQIIDVTAAYPDDTEKQYQAYQKLAHLGVIDVHMPGSDDKTGMREKDLQITHNLHAMNNYLISGLVQERKRTEGLEDRIDKMEEIIRAFGHEPYKGIAHNNDGLLAENSTKGLGYNKKNSPFKGDYNKEKDLRTITYKDSKGIKVYSTSNEDGPMSKVTDMITKKFHSVTNWGRKSILKLTKKDKK